jgi:hypothetical protein
MWSSVGLHWLMLFTTLIAPVSVLKQAEMTRRGAAASAAGVATTTVVKATPERATAAT